jgi:hypothetical protein
MDILRSLIWPMRVRGSVTLICYRSVTNRADFVESQKRPAGGTQDTLYEQFTEQIEGLTVAKRKRAAR